MRALRTRQGGRLILAPAALLILLSACGRSPRREAGDVPDDPGAATIGIRCPAFADGKAIPTRYTCDGNDVSPPLEWSGVPGSARSLAIVVDDPDAPGGTWAHWVLFGVPPGVVSLPQAIPGDEQPSLGSGGKTARHGRNDFGKLGYGGPCPPEGTHHYVFRIYALDTELSLEPGTTRAKLLDAIRGHVLAQGRMTGVYSRR